MAGFNTVVNEATMATSVLEAVSESIVRLTMIVEVPMSTAVNEATWPTSAARAVLESIV